MAEARDILVVDDEGPIVEMLVELLREEGYGVREARTAEQAMRAIASQPPHLMLMDVRLPDIDGVTFLQKLRDQGHVHLPVILMTADMQVIKEQPVLATDYLAKPFEIDSLLNMVGRHLAS